MQQPSATGYDQVIQDKLVSQVLVAGFESVDHKDAFTEWLASPESHEAFTQWLAARQEQPSQ